MRSKLLPPIAKLAWVLAAAGFTLLAADAAPAPAPPLRVGVAAVSPPMIFKEGGRIVGVEADFARAFAASLKREVKFVDLPWEDLIDALNEGKIDIIMSAMSVTRARQFRVAFAEPYLRVGQTPLVRAEDRNRYGLLVNGLAGKTIGVRKGTTADLLVQQEFSRAKRKYFKADEEGAKALQKGKLDLFIDDSPMIWYLAGTYEAQGLAVAPLVLSDEVLAWGVRRSDDQLLSSANEFLKQLRADGELNRILRRWVPKLQ